MDIFPTNYNKPPKEMKKLVLWPQFDYKTESANYNTT